jgi:hypothetical protein
MFSGGFFIFGAGNNPVAHSNAPLPGTGQIGAWTRRKAAWRPRRYTLMNTDSVCHLPLIKPNVRRIRCTTLSTLDVGCSMLDVFRPRFRTLAFSL